MFVLTPNNIYSLKLKTKNLKAFYYVKTDYNPQIVIP